MFDADAVIAPPTDAPDRVGDLADRAVLVTGATGGLGRAVARALGRCGATVILHGRSQSALESLYDELRDAGAPEPAMLPLDLARANWVQFADIGAQIGEHIGRLDGIVHAAAHFSAFSAMDVVEPAEWERSFRVNVTASWAVTRACLPLLRRADPRASVVFVGDRAGAFYGAYGVAKEALWPLVRTWTLDQGKAPNPRMNLYLPGPIRTALRARGFPGELPSQVPPPDAAVPALLWLLSPASEAINGRIVRAHGAAVRGATAH